MKRDPWWVYAIIIAAILGAAASFVGRTWPVLGGLGNLASITKPQPRGLRIRDGLISVESFAINPALTRERTFRMMFVRFVRIKDGTEVFINPELVTMVTVVNGETVVRTSAGEYSSVAVKGEPAAVALHLQMAVKAGRASAEQAIA